MNKQNTQVEIGDKKSEEDLEKREKLPANIQAEQALLGTILTNNKAFDRVADFLEGDHFSNRLHGYIFDSVKKQIESGQIADIVTMKGKFEHSGILKEAGNPEYLTELITAMVGVPNVAEYGHIIHDCWIRRQLINVGNEIVTSAFVKEDTGQDQILMGEEALYELGEERFNENGFSPFGAVLAKAIDAAGEAYNNNDGIAGLTSGLKDLDKKTGGLHKSDLIILAGRPGMGKTALATKIAYSAAEAIMREQKEEEWQNKEKKKGGVAVFSLEMSSEQLATRILCEQAEISGENIRRGNIVQKDFDRIVAVSNELQELPLYIDDTPSISITAMRTRCRRLKRTHGLNLIIVDYLQLMRPAIGVRTENRVLEISMITQGLKALAKEMDVPVIALSQLSRQVEQREDKRPMLSDLRESGSIEQDADGVMFIYRDAYYLEQKEPKESSFGGPGEKFNEAMEKWQHEMSHNYNVAELILAKQRHGPTGVIRLFFDGQFTRFGDLDEVHEY